MANVAKNIKRLRTEKGITQDAFSKMINVSRQAVSSWETGRTQPDLEMIGIIADSLEVSVEELIYGEKRNIKIDNEEKNYVSTATIIMSVLGGFMLFAGVILILVWSWSHIPVIAKTAFSLVPMLAGIVFSVWVLVKMKNDSFMEEISSLGWALGNVITVVFVNELFELDMEAVKILFISLILAVPALFVMKSASVLTSVYVMAVSMAGTWFYSSINYYDVMLICITAFATGILFTAVYKKSLGFSRHRYAQWISIASVVLFIRLYLVEHSCVNPFVPVLCVFLFCYLAEKENDLHSALHFFGTAGSVVTLFLCLTTGIDLIWFELNRDELGSLIASALILVAAFKLNGKSIKENVFKKLQVMFLTLSIFVSAGFSVAAMLIGETDEAFVIVFEVVSSIAFSVYIFAVSFTFVIQGLKENRLYPLNLGFVSIGALAIIMLTELEMDMLVKGCVLLIMGGLLMFVNLRITNKRVKEKKDNCTEQSDTQVK